jgi:hypothetical protein
VRGAPGAARSLTLVPKRSFEEVRSQAGAWDRGVLPNRRERQGFHQKGFPRELKHPPAYAGGSPGPCRCGPAAALVRGTAFIRTWAA